MNDKKRSLLSKLRWWEVLLASAVFAYLIGRTLINIPNINDDGVKQVEDVVVSWSCSGLGKSEYQKLIGQSGKSYVMGVIGDTHELGDVLRGLWLFSDVVGFE